jgi:hypothetical protein
MILIKKADEESFFTGFFYHYDHFLKVLLKACRNSRSEFDENIRIISVRRARFDPNPFLSWMAPDLLFNSFPKVELIKLS